jgi:hypothetical protein
MGVTTTVGAISYMSVLPTKRPSSGPWGYGDYLAAIADPQHEQHEEMLQWRGPFDPEAFHANQATTEMRKVM